MRPRQNVHHFPDDILKWIFLNENVWILIKNWSKLVTRGPINIIQRLVQIMAWRRPGDKPLSEPMVVRSLTHICVTRPECVNSHCMGTATYVFFVSVCLIYCGHCGTAIVSPSDSGRRRVNLQSLMTLAVSSLYFFGFNIAQWQSYTLVIVLILWNIPRGHKNISRMNKRAWTNDWVNNREAGDLRRHRTHYDVTVMPWFGDTITELWRHSKWPLKSRKISRHFEC